MQTFASKVRTHEQRFFQEEVSALIKQCGKFEDSVSIEVTHFVQDYVQAHIHALVIFCIFLVLIGKMSDG
jgi:hypothetical protein